MSFSWAHIPHSNKIKGKFFSFFGWEKEKVKLCSHTTFHIQIKVKVKLHKMIANLGWIGLLVDGWPKKQNPIKTKVLYTSVIGRQCLAHHIF